MEAENRKKLFLLWVLVLSVALFVLLVWVFNMKSELQRIQEEASLRETEEIDNLKQDVSDFFDKVNSEAKKIETIAENEIEKNKKTALPENENINQPVKEESSLPEEESNVLPTQNNSNCPPYINCMPTIGEARPCVISPNCEGITVPVY